VEGREDGGRDERRLREMGKRHATDKLWQDMLGSQGNLRWKSIQDIQSFYAERITSLHMWPAFKFGLQGWEGKPVRLGTGFDGAGLASKVFSAVVGSAGSEYSVSHVWSSEPNEAYRAFLRENGHGDQLLLDMEDWSTGHVLDDEGFWVPAQDVIVDVAIWGPDRRNWSSDPMRKEARRDKRQAPHLADGTSALPWATSVECLRNTDVPRSLFQQASDIMKGPSPQPFESMVRDLVVCGHEAVAVKLDTRQTGLPQRRTEVYVPTRRVSAQPEQSEFKRRFLRCLEQIIPNKPIADIRDILREDCGELATQQTLDCVSDVF
jgi:hypothetical protein